MEDAIKYKCPCCNYLTLEEDLENYGICPVCYWENDPIQNIDIHYEGGANNISLDEARKNFNEFGAVEKKFIKMVRKAFDNEIN